MCLKTLHNDKQKKEFLDTLDDETTVYKAVIVKENYYYPPYIENDFRYVEGLNVDKATGNICVLGKQFNDRDTFEYQKGFHFFLKEQDAIDKLLFLRHIDEKQRYVLIKCQIKKEWITSVGTEYKIAKNGVDFSNVVVTDRAIFPKVE